MHTTAEIGLVEAIDRVREELAAAVANGAGADIQFPVGEITLDFQVGLTKSTDGSGKINLYVLELGGRREYAHDTIQTVTVVLGPPVDASGDPIKVSGTAEEMPG